MGKIVAWLENLANVLLARRLATPLQRLHSTVRFSDKPFCDSWILTYYSLSGLVTARFLLRLRAFDEHRQSLTIETPTKTKQAVSHGLFTTVLTAGFGDDPVEQTKHELNLMRLDEPEMTPDVHTIPSEFVAGSSGSHIV